MSWGKKKESTTTEQTLDLGDIDTLLDPPTQESPTEEPDAPAQEPDDSAASLAMGTIGTTLCLQGDLTGDEDVTIDGKVEGRIEVRDHTVTIGPNASIKAAVQARCVIIQGQVVGDVTAEEKVEIAASGSLVGDIRANRVVLAEAARFRGRIDMGWEEPTRGASEPAANNETEAKETARPAREAVLGALDWDKTPTKGAATKGPTKAAQTKAPAAPAVSTLD